jgi:hypothetical protein
LAFWCSQKNFKPQFFIINLRVGINRHRDHLNAAYHIRDQGVQKLWR